MIVVIVAMYLTIGTSVATVMGVRPWWCFLCFYAGFFLFDYQYKWLMLIVLIVLQDCIHLCPLGLHGVMYGIVLLLELFWAKVTGPQLRGPILHATVVYMIYGLVFAVTSCVIPDYIGAYSLSQIMLMLIQTLMLTLTIVTLRFPQQERRRLDLKLSL